MAQNSTNMAAKIKADEASTAVKYNTFRIKKPKPQNRNRSRLGKPDRELVAPAALGTRVGKSNAVFATSKKKFNRAWFESTTN